MARPRLRHNDHLVVDMANRITPTVNYQPGPVANKHFATPLPLLFGLHLHTHTHINLNTRFGFCSYIWFLPNGPNKERTRNDTKHTNSVSALIDCSTQTNHLMRAGGGPGVPNILTSAHTFNVCVSTLGREHIWRFTLLTTDYKLEDDDV